MSTRQIGSRRLQALLLALGSVILTLLIARVLDATWLASAVVAFVLACGVFLFWAAAEERKPGELGRSIVTGGLVGLALAVAQSSATERDRQEDADRQRWSARESLAVTLGTQDDLKAIDLSGRDLANFYLRGRNLTDARLPGADLCRASLTDARLLSAVLNAAALREADLSNAKLRRAQMWRADLRRARLFHADLRGALLNEADLREADFEDADLRGADLSSAKLDRARFEEAQYDARTRWPDGVDPEDLGADATRPGGIERERTRFEGNAKAHCHSILWRDAPDPP